MTSSLLQQAIDAYGSGDAARAEALARKACESDSTEEQAVLLCSGLMLHRQANDEARSLLVRALGNGLQSAQASANLALCCLRLGNYEEATEHAKAAAQAEPSLVSAWNTLGAALLELKQPAQAESLLQEGLARHPDHPALTLLLARSRQALDRGEEAEADFRRFEASGGALAEQAEQLALSGRLIEAEHRYRQLIATQPRNAQAHAGLGRLLMRRGRSSEAVDVLSTALRLQPNDPTSRHFLAMARGEPPPGAEPAYVRSLFDGYAGNFDQHLVESLGYRIPGEIAGLLADASADLSQTLDLGCGTGLVAAALQGQVGAIDGVDLSPAMLEQARGRGLYRHLVEDDALRFLSTASGRYTTVIAADVLIYIGALERLLAPLAESMEAGGLFAFSIEVAEAQHAPLDEHGRADEIPGAANDGAGRAEWSLDPASGRYRHDPAAVDRLLQRCGFSAAQWTQTTIRSELSNRIPGAIGLARRL
jgi:predicted TPR repeat methyltransferase